MVLMPLSVMVLKLFMNSLTITAIRVPMPGNLPMRDPRMWQMYYKVWLMSTR